jgi:hypothetical protein
MSPTPEITLRELDSRTNDGIEVWLLWNRVTNAVSIVVADERAGKSFELEVDPAEALGRASRAADAVEQRLRDRRSEIARVLAGRMAR